MRLVTIRPSLGAERALHFPAAEDERGREDYLDYIDYWVAMEIYGAEERETEPDAEQESYFTSQLEMREARMAGDILDALNSSTIPDALLLWACLPDGTRDAVLNLKHSHPTAA